MNNISHIKNIVVLSFILLSFYGLHNGYPFSSLPENHDEIFAIYRIIFTVLVIFRLFRTLSALPMIWGYAHHKKLKYIWSVWLVNSLFLLFGFFAEIASIVNFILFICVFYKSKYYSIEEIYFQINCFVLIFLPLSMSYSIDSMLGFSHSISITEFDNVIPINFLSWALALLLLSAAYEKINTKSWRKGLSFYYFIGSPHLVIPKYHWLRKKLWLCKAISIATVFGQGFIFISYYFSGVKEVFFIGQIIFGVMLFTVVDISFIGQIFSLQFLLLFVLSLGDINNSNYNSGFMAGLFFSMVLLFSVVRCFYNKYYLNKIINILTKLTLGLVPIQVFSDKHLFGLYIYKVVDNSGNVLIDAFNEKGEPGRFQRWYPRYYQGAMYPVTDACILKRYYPKNKNSRESQLLDLGACAFNSSPASQSILIYVKAINPSEEYTPSTFHWVDKFWTPVYEIKNIDGNLIGDWVGNPPEIKKITRVVV